MDTIVSVTIIAFLIFFTKSLVLLFLPPALSFSNIVRGRIERKFSGKDHLISLPSDIRERIAAVMDVPRNVIFLRGEGNDCRSVSLFFVHIIFLPQFFETDINNPNKQALLLHELAHGHFSDYLSVSWVWLACIFATYVTFQYFLEWDGGTVRGLVTRSEGVFNLTIPFYVLILLCVFDAVGMLHRREVNADFGASRSNPKLFRAFLERQVNKGKYFKYDKRQFQIIINNWFFHPTYENRLALLTGNKQIRSQSIFLPAILAGFCPLYIVLVLTGSVFTTALLEKEIVSVIALPLSVFCLVQLGIVLNEMFGRKSPVTRSDKFVFWLGLLAGYELLALTFSYAMNFDSGGEWVILASNGETAVIQLPFVLASILLGHFIFFAHARLCSMLFGTTILGVFATPIFAYACFSMIGGIQMTGNVSVLTSAGILGGVLAVCLIVLLLFEMALHVILRTTFSVFSRNIVSGKRN